MDTITVTQPTLLTVADSVTNGSCLNGGTITLTVTGGTPAYSFNWGGGVATQNRSGLVAGTYTVTVTDHNGCTTTKSATISAVLPLLVTATPTNVTCFGGANGSIAVTDTGGTPAYSYNWGGGITTQNRTGLVPGNYTVTVTDRVGCTAIATASITQPVSGISINLAPVNATCTVGGTITTLASGGAGGYSYNWGAGITTQNRSGLGAGTYTITVTDLSGCTATASTVITSASTIQIASTPAPVSCNGGNNGAINITASGGSGGFTYNWGAGITTQNRTGLTAGIYDITVTDNNGCTASASVTISQPAVLNSVAVAVNISCNGGSNGTINLTDTGGTSPYTFNWGGGITTQNRTGLGLGTYTVTVTDNKGCTATATATIAQPQPLQVTDTVSNVLCNGGSTGIFTARATGGTNPYRYNWGQGATSNPVDSGLPLGAYTVTVTDANGCTAAVSNTIGQPPVLTVTPVATTTACDSATGTVTITVNGGVSSYAYRWSNGATVQNISSLISNAYSVTVTDANGCTATTSTHVSQTAGPQIVLVASPDSCSGQSNGNINSTVTNGTPGYTYLWNNNQISSSISGLSAGIYTVTVHDAHNCSATASDSVRSPQPVVVILNPVNVKCFGDSDAAISSVVTGGTPGYTYLWSNGASTANVSTLGPNTYTVTVSYLNLCTAISSSTILRPAQLVVSVFTDSATCGEPNGAAQLSVSGGRKPYGYVWLPNASDSASAAGLNAAHYAVTITDSAGCAVTDTFNIGGKVTTILRPYLGPDTSICPGNNTSIALNAGAYQSYFWQDSSTKQYFTVIDSGTYWVVVTDSNGCKSSDTILVTQKCNNQLAVPSAFSPNGDGKNDVFKPYFIDAPAIYTLHIYNRWGALVFESNNINIGWDGNFNGKAQPVGTFIYYIQYTYTGEKEQGLEGALELLR